MLIAGDSYSNNEKWPSWISLLKVDYTLLGGRGYSNWDIYKKLEPYAPQRAIINLTHLHRLPWSLTSGIGTGYSGAVGRHNKAAALNKQIAERLVETWEDAFIWSPFPHYESFKGVHYIPLYSENQMWEDGEFNKSDPRSFTNHFTEKGNQQLADIINSMYLNS